MLSLEVRINNRTNRWTNVTNDFLNITSRNHSSGRKYWQTLRGVENYIVKAVKTYPWLTRENFRINGTEEERRKPQKTAASLKRPPPTWKCMWETYSSALGATA